MNRRSSNQFSPLLGRGRGAWTVAVVASVASLTAWLSSCLAPDAQQGKTAGSTASSSGTPGGTGGDSGAGGGSGGGSSGGSGGGTGSGGAGGGGGSSSKVSPAWLKAYGNPWSDNARSIAADASGNAIVVGAYQYVPLVTPPFTLPNPQSTDAFVMKLGPDGEVAWSRNIGGPGDEYALAVAVDPKDGSILVAGSFSQTLDTTQCPALNSAGGADIFVVKLKPEDGSCEWSRSFGDGSAQSAYSLAVDAEQNIAVMGTFSGTVDFGSGTPPLTAVDHPMFNDMNEIFVAKLDSGGQALFTRAVGDSTADPTSIDVAVDASNDLVIIGAFEGALTLSGEPVLSEGSPNFFLAKLAGGSLDPVWSITSGDGANSQLGRSVAVTASNNIIFTGFFAGEFKLEGAPLAAGSGHDVVVAAVDPAGSALWSKRIGGIGTQYAVSVALDAGENILVGGSFTGVLDFGDGSTLIGTEISPGMTLDAYVAKLSPKGERIWSFQGSGADHQVTAAVAPAPDGAYAAGSFLASVTYGEHFAMCAGTDDIYIVKINE
jgi:hypothetical protein